MRDNRAMTLRLLHLCDAPAETAAELVRRFEAEWAPYYGPGGPGDAARDIAACADKDALPICLVALDPDGTVVGTAALKERSVGEDIAPGPWLAAVLVWPGQRGKGVGRALVAAIEGEARRLGYPALYASTDSAQGILRRRGWTRIGETGSLRGRIQVFRIALEGS